MTSRLFTNNEMAVILSLIRNPEHSDTEISASMNLNLFTFNKIKNSLMKSDMVQRFYVPNYGKLGFEILGVSRGSNMDTFYQNTLRKNRINEKMGSFPRMSIFGLLEENSGMMFHIIPDFTAMKRLLRMKQVLCDPVIASTHLIDHSFFSFHDLKIERFFDVEQIFSSMITGTNVPVLEAVTPGQRAASTRWSDFFEIRPDESRTEIDEVSQEVLIEMVKNPALSEGGRIKRLGISRYRFGKIKEKLFEEGFIKPFVSANLIGMGYEVMIFTHMKFKPGQDPRNLFQKFEDKMASNLIVIAFDHTEVIGIGIFKNLMEGSRAQSNMRKAMREQDFLAGEPDIRIFSLPNCEFQQPLSFHQPLQGRCLIKDPSLLYDRT